MPPTTTRRRGRRPPPAPLSDRYGSQVDAEAILRFNPARSEVRSALEQLEQERQGDIASADASARGVVSSARRVAPQVAGRYRGAQEEVGGLSQRLAGDLAKLGPAADTIKAATSRDSAGTERRLAEALATSDTGFKAREFEAESGKVQATANANSRYGQEVGKLRSRLSDIATEEGAFRQGRSGELTEEARARSLSRENSRRSARVSIGNNVRTNDQSDTNSRRSAQARARGNTAGALPGGRKPATQEQHNRARDQVAAARSSITDLRQKGVPEAEIRKALIAGRLVVPNPTGGKPIVEEVPKTPEELVGAALGAEAGALSREQIAALHRRGLVVARLDLPTPPRRRAQRVGGNAPGPGGRSSRPG